MADKNDQDNSENNDIIEEHGSDYSGGGGGGGGFGGGGGGGGGGGFGGGGGGGGGDYAVGDTNDGNETVDASKDTVKEHKNDKRCPEEEPPEPGPIPENSEEDWWPVACDLPESVECKWPKKGKRIGVPGNWQKGDVCPPKKWVCIKENWSVTQVC